MPLSFPSFLERVLDVVRVIPRGQVMTYAEVATNAGSPRAYRAVGSVMKKNLRPDVPCHRVIPSSGGLGGYNRGGTAQKRKLLISEGVDVSRFGA